MESIETTAATPVDARSSAAAVQGGRGPDRVLSLGLVAGCLWLPFVVAALLNDRVLREPQDFWLWPGLVPGYLVIDDLYSPLHGLFTLGHLVVWTLVARRVPRLAAIGALSFGTFSALRLTALLAI